RSAPSSTSSECGSASKQRMRPAATCCCMRATEAGAARNLPAVHQCQARRLAEQLERPVERRVAAAEDHQALALELGRALHPTVDARALEGLGAGQRDAPRLKRADARRDYHATGVEADSARAAQRKHPRFARPELPA